MFSASMVFDCSKRLVRLNLKELELFFLQQQSSTSGTAGECLRKQQTKCSLISPLREHDNRIQIQTEIITTQEVFSGYLLKRLICLKTGNRGIFVTLKCSQTFVKIFVKILTKYCDGHYLISKPCWLGLQERHVCPYTLIIEFH